MEEDNTIVTDAFENEFFNLINISSEFVANSTALDPLSERQNLDRRTVQNLTLFVTFSLVAALSLLINLRVFYIVFVTSKRKSRPVNILVAHSSAIVIGLTCVLYRYILEKTSIFSLAGPGICNLFSLLGNTIYNVFPLNIGAIIWIRTRNNAVNLRKSCAYRAIGVMWTITFFANLPTIFMVKSNTNPDTNIDNCKQIPLFGSFEITITYESLRLLLFNIMVCAYLIRATIKVQSSIKYLQISKRVLSERTMKQTRKARFVHLHTIVLIFTWFPHGLGIFLYKILARFGWTTDYVKYLTPLVILNYIVFILCPLSYVILLEEMPILKLFAPCFWKSAINDTITNGIDKNVHPDIRNPEIFGWRVNPPLKPRVSLLSKRGVKIEENYNSIDFNERSFLTTVGVTEISEYRSPSITRIIPWQIPIQANPSSIQAVLTSRTSDKPGYSLVDFESENSNIEQETILAMPEKETLI